MIAQVVEELLGHIQPAMLDSARWYTLDLLTQWAGGRGQSDTTAKASLPRSLEKFAYGEGDWRESLSTSGHACLCEGYDAYLGTHVIHLLHISWEALP